jgi:hypothetical protein
VKVSHVSPDHAGVIGATGDARSARPYMNPYLAGVGIGLVLLAALVVMGRGLGASGAFSSAVTAAMSGASPDRVAGATSYAPLFI